MDWKRNLEIEAIDFGTVHVYPDHWFEDQPEVDQIIWTPGWIKKHIADGHTIGKPVVFDEFGRKIEKGDRDERFEEWTSLFYDQCAAGDCVWMIAGRVNGPDEDHVYVDYSCYYPDYDGFTFWDNSQTRTTMEIIKNHADQMNSKSPTSTTTTSTSSTSSSITTTTSTPWSMAYDKIWGVKMGENIPLLRSFRNDVLAYHEVGRDYIFMLYDNSLEILTLLIQNPSLTEETKEVVDGLMPRIQLLLDRGEMSLSKKQLTVVESLLAEFETEASPKLRAAIRKARKDIREGKIFEQLGITIIE